MSNISFILCRWLINTSKPLIFDTLSYHSFQLVLQPQAWRVKCDPQKPQGSQSWLSALRPLRSEIRLAIMFGHWPHMIQRRGRSLVYVQIRSADNLSHPINKSTPGQHGVICVYVQVSWRGKTWRRRRIWPKLPSDVEPAGVRLCHMLALSVHMRPTCTELAESGFLCWVKATCHVPTASKGIEGRWDLLSIRSVLIRCTIKGINETLLDLRSHIILFPILTGYILFYFHPIQFSSVDHWPQRFSMNGRLGSQSWLQPWPQSFMVPDMIQIIIMTNEWMAGKCASITCACHLISFMQSSYIMQLKNGQKHWLWWNTSNSFDVCYHYSPAVWSVTVSRGLCCIAQGKEKDCKQMTLSPTSHPHLWFKDGF